MFFINQAHAEEAVAAAAKANAWTQFLPLVAILLIFYFLLIRPQQKRAKEHQNMLKMVKKGDKIVTSGGIVAIIVKNIENEPFVLVEISEGVKVKIKRDTIAEVLSAENLSTTEKVQEKETKAENKKAASSIKGKSAKTKKSK